MCKENFLKLIAFSSLMTSHASSTSSLFREISSTVSYGVISEHSNECGLNSNDQTISSHLLDTKTTNENYEAIKPYFNEEFYANKYGIPLKDALTHYLKEGAALKNWPHPAFDPSWYLQCFPESQSPFSDFLTLPEWSEFRKKKGTTLDDLNKIKAPQYLWDDQTFKTEKPFFHLPYRLIQKNAEAKWMKSLYFTSLENVNALRSIMMMETKLIAADPLKTFYRTKKPIDDHRMWVTSLSTPYEPPMDKLNNWIKDRLKHAAPGTGHFWCLRKSDIPKAIDYLESSGIKIHEISELFPMKGMNLAYAFYRTHQYTLCSDIIRMNLNRYNGTEFYQYTDLGWQYTTDFRYALEIYDMAFCHMQDSFFDRNFFFARKENPLINMYLEKLEDPTWLQNYMQQNISNAMEQLVAIGCGTLNVLTDLNRKDYSILLAPIEGTLFKSHRMGTWLNKNNLFGNKTLYEKGPKISDLLGWTYTPSTEIIIGTCGSFEGFHLGHLNVLKQAKTFGEKEAYGEIVFLGAQKEPEVKLIVGVSTDLMNAKKSKSHAFFVPQEERKAIVAAIKNVDGVFDEESMEQKPEYFATHKMSWFVMGDDWKDQFNILATNQTAIAYMLRTPGVSTSARYLAIQEDSSNPHLKEWKEKIAEYEHKEQNVNERVKQLTEENKNYRAIESITQIQILNPYGERFVIKEHFPTYYIQLYKVAKDLQEILQKSDVKYFFTSGTLLGAVRSGGGFPWDDDLDVNLLDPTETEIEKLQNNIIGAGYKILPSTHGWQGFQVLNHHEGKLQGYCDFFIAKKDAQNAYRFPSGWPKYTFKDEDVFPTKLAKFGPIFLTIPGNYPAVLHSNFGASYMWQVKEYNHLFGQKANEAKWRPITSQDLIPAGPFGDVVLPTL